MELWNKLKALSLVTNGNPTLSIGDFNCTRFPSERKACHNRSGDYAKFNIRIRQLNLLDIQICNCKFTWIGPSGKISKLDRAMINAEWGKTGKWKLKALSRKNSDHRPILLY